MTIRKELVDELLAGREPSAAMRQGGLLGDLERALPNRMVAAGLDHHVDQGRAGGGGKNHRDGATRKRVPTGDATVEVTVPRDREARFDPVLAGRCQRRPPGFDDKVVSLHARGTGTREIQGRLEEPRGVEVSPQPISTVTDAVAAEVADRQSRPLDLTYPLVFFGALRVKVRDEGVVRKGGLPGPRTMPGGSSTSLLSLDRLVSAKA